MMIETDKANKFKGLMWVIAVIMIAYLFAFGITPFVRIIPWQWEKALGQMVTVKIANDVCKDQDFANEQLNKILNRIYPLTVSDHHIDVHVILSKSNEINAYAQLGGLITINQGLLAQAESPEEIAAVIAHEIEHVRQRHILEGFIVRLLTIEGLKLIFSNGAMNQVQWSGFFLDMNFSRTQEALADKGALERLKLAGVDNKGFMSFFKRLKDLPIAPSIISDHPSNNERLTMIKNFSTYQVQPIMSKEQWEALQSNCRGE